MHRILVRSDLLKSFRPSGRQLTTTEKMIMILQERIKEATTDVDRKNAERALKDYLGKGDGGVSGVSRRSI